MLVRGHKLVTVHPSGNLLQDKHWARRHTGLELGRFELHFRFLLCDADMHRAYMLQQRGWLSVTRRYCIKTAKPILKLFRPSGSPIILVFLTPAPIPNSKGNPFSGGVKYTGWENWRFSTEIPVYLGKRYEIGRCLLWNVKRKSWVPDRMV